MRSEAVANRYHPAATAPRPAARSRDGRLVIALVNLMPLPAMQRTADEFRALLRAHPQTSNVSLRCFTSRQPAMSAAGAPGPALTHEPLHALWDAPIDGLIVTGMEPGAGTIADEPLLPVLRRLVEWAAQNTKSAIFSCLAAHAAVWCLDEIPRQRLPQKLSGVFACTQSAGHPLMAAMPDQWVTPHSRHNTVNEAALHRAGYTILSHAPHLGADMFLKQNGNSTFVFLQGHPEYGPLVLLDEFRRDLKRHSSGLTPLAPLWPENYLGDRGRHLATAHSAGNKARVHAALSTITDGPIDHPWRPAATTLIQGWLGFLANHPAARHRTAP